MIEPYPTLARYNAWMNERLYACAAGLDEATRRRDLGAFFGSIHATLDHILHADRVWLGRFRDEPYRGGPLGTLQYEDFESLRAAREALDADLIAFADSRDAAWLQAEQHWTSGADQLRRAAPNWLLLSHVFNHQTHHRGQVTTLLRQLGIDPGVTDLPWMPGAARLEACP